MKITGLKIAAFAVLFLLGPYPVLATDDSAFIRNPCEELDRLIARKYNGKYFYDTPVALRDADEARVWGDLSLGGYYTDAGKEKLYSAFLLDSSFSIIQEDYRRIAEYYRLIVELYPDVDKEKLRSAFPLDSSLRINGGEEDYRGIVELYPETKIRLIVRVPPNQFYTPNKEIDDFVEPLKEIAQDTWNGEGKYANQGPVPYEPCHPLVGAIPGKHFDDGKYRLFIRHFPFGIRDASGNEYGLLGEPMCEQWPGDTRQLRFYEAFTPLSFMLKHGRVFVDKEYAGAAKDGEFHYLCGVNNTVKARMKILDKPPGKPKETLEYLNGKGFIRSGDAQAYTNNIPEQQMEWELQVLRNLHEGRELYNK